MKNVAFVWNPSEAAGIDGQNVRIFNAESLEVYGEARLDFDAHQFTARVPEGTFVQGSVTTTRGEEQTTALSDVLQVGYGPLTGATELSLLLVTPTNPIAPG